MSPALYREQNASVAQPKRQERLINLALKCCVEMGEGLGVITEGHKVVAVIRGRRLLERELRIALRQLTGKSIS